MPNKITWTVEKCNSKIMRNRDETIRSFKNHSGRCLDRVAIWCIEASLWLADRLK